MSFKNIINIFIILLCFNLLSCKSLDILSNGNDPIKKNKIIHEIKDLEAFIDINDYTFDKIKTEDYYKDYFTINFNPKLDIKKIHTINAFDKKYENDRPLKSIIYKNNIINLNFKSELKFTDLKTFKTSKVLQINDVLLNNDSYPTSISRISEKFYIIYSDGLIINVDIEGKIIWKKKYKDVIRTPLKIYDNNLLIVMSDKITLINSSNGSVIWEFAYKNNNNAISSFGGEILNLNHLLFFILPNNEIGQIDTIFKTKYDLEFEKIKIENSLKNSFDKFHLYEKYFIYFNQQKYLSTIDIFEKNIIINKQKILDSKSAYFFNNTLMILNSNSYLKSYNVLNKKLFWETNLSDYIKSDVKIIKISKSVESITIFFNNGKIIQLNHLNGDIISKNLINSKNIIKIEFINDYIFAYTKNGKINIYKQ
jgi:hypothetical protein